MTNILNLRERDIDTLENLDVDYDFIVNSMDGRTFYIKRLS